MAGSGSAPWGRSLIARLLAVLLASGPAVSCTEVDVTAVDIAMLEVEPQALSLTVGDTARLSATLRDANGNELSGRAVTWTSSSPDIAIVDAGGRVAALASGTTVIEASSNGIRNEAMVDIGPRPQITVDRSTVGFTGRVGEAAPQPAEVTVRANGGGGLADLSTSIEYADGQPTGWLSASLSGRTAPATLTLTPSMSSLNDGRYIATVTVTSPDAGNSRTITVTFDVQERQPVIALDETVVGFSATRGGPDPSPASISVSNAGGGTLNDLGASITYGAGTTEDWLTAALSSTAAPAELTLSARIGSLAAGTHTASVMIASSVASNTQTITVTFDVAAPPPSIGVQTSSLLITATGGGPDPSPVGVAITNIGGGQLTGLAAGVSHAAGEPTGWLTAALSRSDAPATLMVRATVAGLSVGTYTGTIQITAPGVANSPRSIQVTLVVNPAAASPEIGLSSTSLMFQATAGGSSPSATTVNVTNTGGGTLDGLALSVSYPGGQPGGWLNVSIGAGTAPTTITAQPVTGSLSAGTYGATIEVTSSQASNSPRTIDVAFTVNAAPTPPSISLSTTSLSFQATAGGGNPSATSVSVSNGGGGTLGGLGVTVRYDSGQPVGWLNVSIGAGMAPTTITAQPVTGSLPAGTYGATIEVTSSQASNSPRTIDVTFQVAPGLQPPTAPVLVAADVDDDEVDLKWEDRSNNETSFRVERSKYRNSGWAIIATLPAGTKKYTDKDVDDDEVYFYRIAACNAAGCSTSNVIEVEIDD